jgi:hypothetical protein
MEAVDIGRILASSRRELTIVWPSMVEVPGNRVWLSAPATGGGRGRVRESKQAVVAATNRNKESMD